MFHWNREASVEGSHIFLRMSTHMPAGKNRSYLESCFANSIYIGVRSNNNDNNNSNDKTARVRNTKLRSGAG